MKSLFNPYILDTTLYNTAIILIIVGCAILLCVAIVVPIVINKKKKSPRIDNNVWLIALGNKENIKEVNAIGSRLTVNLVDKEKIDREKLKELGVSSVLTMSNKVTLVIEGKAEIIAEAIKEGLNQSAL